MFMVAMDPVDIRFPRCIEKALFLDVIDPLSICIPYPFEPLARMSPLI